MAHNRQILLAEDDDLLRPALASQLADTFDCTVTQASTNAQAASMLARLRHFDAVILDVNMPDGDGRDLCARLRRGGLAAPIIMLSGAGREADIVRGLEAGANDYVVKPFRVSELVARLRAQIRASEASDFAELVIGPFLFRPSSKTMQQAGGPPVRLTEKEAALLKFLYRADGALVARQTLLREIWGYSAQASTHTVETHIYRLRRKIEPDAASPRLLVSASHGYRLSLGPVARSGAGRPALTWQSSGGLAAGPRMVRR